MTTQLLNCDSDVESDISGAEVLVTCEHCGGALLETENGTHFRCPHCWKTEAVEESGVGVPASQSRSPDQLQTKYPANILRSVLFGISAMMLFCAVHFSGSHPAWHLLYIVPWVIGALLGCIRYACVVTMSQDHDSGQIATMQATPPPATGIGPASNPDTLESKS